MNSKIKSRKQATEKPNSGKNPLREKIKSSKSTDKRKARRDFFAKDGKDFTKDRREKRTSFRDEPKEFNKDRNRDGERRSFRDNDRNRDEERRPFRDRDRNRDGERRSFRDNDRSRDGERRSFRDNDRSRDGERRSFRDNDRNRDGERRSFRDNDRSRDGERRSFRDNDRNRDGERRSFRDNDRYRDGERESFYERDRNRDEERRPFRERDDRRKPQKDRRSTVLDSDIIREIVQKRRATGRSKHTPKVLSLAWSEERGAIRLNKYISNSGICSRREADDLIAAGVILVNGKVVTELGTKVMPTDEIRYEDKILQREKPVYILLNKPKDFITTTDDERSRDNVMMLIEGACPQRVYPVGRLDRSTTGLLLLTNDGEMTKKLTHPRYGVKKIYQVELDKNMSLVDFETVTNGIELEDGMMKPDELEFVDGQKNVLGITLHSGKNRIVRRLFAHLGYEVEKLDRVYYAGLTKKDLPRGEWRFLRQEEINILKMSL